MALVDEHTRKCLGGLVEHSMFGDTWIDELDRFALVRGCPAILRGDNDVERA